MMAKMGYKDGQGLGKNEQGINTALLAKKTDQGAGIIVNLDSSKNDISSEEKEKNIPTNVLCLTNMVGPGEVDGELKGEIEEECRKYGVVLSSEIFEDKTPKVPDEETVRIFIQFADIESCKAACDSLNGRFFDGRQVHARFYSTEAYQNKKFAYYPY